MEESSSSIKRKALVSAVLLVVAAYLFIQGATYATSWSQTEALTRATYYVGAAIIFSIALIPWTRK